MLITKSSTLTRYVVITPFCGVWEWRVVLFTNFYWNNFTDSCFIDDLTFQFSSGHTFTTRCRALYRLRKQNYFNVNNCTNKADPIPGLQKIELNICIYSQATLPDGHVKYTYCIKQSLEDNELKYTGT